MLMRVVPAMLLENTDGNSSGGSLLPWWSPYFSSATFQERRNSLHQARCSSVSAASLQPWPGKKPSLINSYEITRSREHTNVLTDFGVNDFLLLQTLAQQSPQALRSVQRRRY